MRRFFLLKIHDASDRSGPDAAKQEKDGPLPDRSPFVSVCAHEKAILHLNVALAQK